MTADGNSGELFAGDRRALARAVSTIENDGPERLHLLGQVQGRVSRALVIGLTGPPGAGKSTLIDRLITAYRHAGKRVGVIAVDPSSPFTGGAVLGDRIRMQAHAGDEDVFVRSMATRGAFGGVTRATADVIAIVDAAGFDVVIVETVGVGQGEVDVARLADVTVVLAVPGAGDDVQALKSGLMEIADIFVVNKSDREGADAVVTAIEESISIADRAPGQWRPPVLRVSAAKADGIDDLVTAIERCSREPG